MFILLAGAQVEEGGKENGIIMASSYYGKTNNNEDGTTTTTTTTGSTNQQQPTIPPEVSKKILQTFKPDSACTKRIPLDTAAAVSGTSTRVDVYSSMLFRFSKLIVE